MRPPQSWHTSVTSRRSSADEHARASSRRGAGRCSPRARAGLSERPKPTRSGATRAMAGGDERPGSSCGRGTTTTARRAAAAPARRRAGPRRRSGCAGRRLSSVVRREGVARQVAEAVVGSAQHVHQPSQQALEREPQDAARLAVGQPLVIAQRLPRAPARGRHQRRLEASSRGGDRRDSSLAKTRHTSSAFSLRKAPSRPCTSLENGSVRIAARRTGAIASRSFARWRTKAPSRLSSGPSSGTAPMWAASRSACRLAAAAKSDSTSLKCWNTERSDTPARARAPAPRGPRRSNRHARPAHHTADGFENVDPWERAGPLVTVPFFARRIVGALCPDPGRRGGRPGRRLAARQRTAQPAQRHLDGPRQRPRADGSHDAAHRSDLVRTASPVPWLGPRRFVPPPMPIEALPPIDAVLISHSHYDHLDLPTLRALAARGTPASSCRCASARSCAPPGSGPSEELDWWESRTIGDVMITCVPARHWSQRGLGDMNRTLWSGWVAVGPTRTLLVRGRHGLHALSSPRSASGSARSTWPPYPSAPTTRRP